MKNFKLNAIAFLVFALIGSFFFYSCNKEDSNIKIEPAETDIMQLQANGGGASCNVTCPMGSCSITCESGQNASCKCAGGFPECTCTNAPAPTPVIIIDISIVWQFIWFLQNLGVPPHIYQLVETIGHAGQNGDTEAYSALLQDYVNALDALPGHQQHEIEQWLAAHQ